MSVVPGLLEGDAIESAHVGQERTMASTVSTNLGISCFPCGSSADALPTIGVEEEFLLVESRTGTPCLCNAAVAETGSDLGNALQLELSRCHRNRHSSRSVAALIFGAYDAVARHRGRAALIRPR